MALSEFGKAFRGARARGDEEFTFGGKRYKSNRADETPTAWKEGLTKRSNPLSKAQKPITTEGAKYKSDYTKLSASEEPKKQDSPPSSAKKKERDYEKDDSAGGGGSDASTPLPRRSTTGTPASFGKSSSSGSLSSTGSNSPDDTLSDSSDYPKTKQSRPTPAEDTPSIPSAPSIAKKSDTVEEKPKQRGLDVLMGRVKKGMERRAAESAGNTGGTDSLPADTAPNTALRKGGKVKAPIAKAPAKPPAKAPAKPPAKATKPVAKKGASVMPFPAKKITKPGVKSAASKAPFAMPAMKCGGKVAKKKAGGKVSKGRC